MEEYTYMTLEELLVHLEKTKDLHTKVISEMLKADNSLMYPLDLMGISVAKRSMSLIKGFIEMIRQENFICAVPLLRMQLDNSLRFYAAFLVAEPHKLALEFIDGKSIRNFKEKNTNYKLTDRHLVNKLAEHYPSIIKVYEEASGYIHLSDSHLYNVLGKRNSDEQVHFILSDHDIFVTDKIRLETTYTMFELTTIVLWILNSWSLTKETPNIEEWKKKYGTGKGYKK